MLRQLLNAEPLALFVPGLGTPRAVQNDLSAVLVSTAAPPPSDLVLRTAMFSSWGIAAIIGTTALALNTLLYYVARFSAPVVGFLVALVTDGYDKGFAWVALCSGAIALAIVVALVVATRSPHAAAALGERAGRVGRRFAPERVDPGRWSRVLVEFQSRGGEQVRRSGRWAGFDLLSLLLVEGLLLVLCLRFVDVSTEQVSAAAILAVFFVSYPLTALPFSGLGVLDTVLATVLVSDDGVDASALMAGLVVWRVCLLLLPLLLGAISLTLWKRQQASKAEDLATS